MITRCKMCGNRCKRQARFYCSRWCFGKSRIRVFTKQEIELIQTMYRRYYAIYQITLKLKTTRDKIKGILNIS